MGFMFFNKENNPFDKLVFKLYVLIVYKQYLSKHEFDKLMYFM